MGLVVDLKNKYVAASSDGRVVLSSGASGLLEIKIKSFLQKNQLTFMKATKT